MLSDSQIPAPRVPITEKEGGLITREWFRFFNFVYEQIVRLTSFAYGTFSGFETTTWASNTTTQVSITDTALSSGVSVASSQFATVAVVLSVLFNRERMRWWQTIGIAATALAVALIAAGG
jgi:drug/metabolite transporter (DMT)-like permease